MKKSVAVTMRKIQIFFSRGKLTATAAPGLVEFHPLIFLQFFFYFLNLSNVSFSVTGPGAAVDHGAPTSQRISLRANFNFFSNPKFHFGLHNSLETC